MENTTISEMKNSFQAGVDSIYNAIKGQGTIVDTQLGLLLVAGTKAVTVYLSASAEMKDGGGGWFGKATVT